MTDIAFLALAHAHQHLHWLPAALRLAREPGVRVSVLAASPANLHFIGSHDPERRLKLRWLPTPRVRRDGLFTPPPRRLTLRLFHRLIGRFPTVVTTETTSGMLKRYRSFDSSLIEIKHGAGDREGGYADDHRLFDLILVAGEKDRQRMIERGLVRPETCVTAGYAKFELVPPTPLLFPNANPVALYNPHFRPDVSSWHRDGAALVTAMERIARWNFVVAPHVRLRQGPDIVSVAPNVLIDRGSVRSIDMSYTQAASIYIGDASSQVYEYLRTPRPCIFINTHGVKWRNDDAHAHWRLGQVIDHAEALGPAIERAAAMQPDFEPLQRAALRHSIDPSPVPASERQATAILDFVRARGR